MCRVGPAVTGLVGPRLQAIYALLTGRGRLSRREAPEIVGAILGEKAIVSPGTVIAMERQTSDALKAAFDEALEAVRRSPVVNADETGWMEGRERAWLWCAVTDALKVFRIDRNRSKDAFERFLGVFAGILGTDRWSAYRGLTPEQRQLCWAHLLRNFFGIEERGGEGAKIGTEGLKVIDAIMYQWYRFKEGAITRRGLRRLKVHDFMVPEDGKVIPYGVFDPTRNEGYVRVGIDHETSSFAVRTIHRWWTLMGRRRYPKAKSLLVTADGGGSNGPRRGLWKWELQRLANATGLTITVCHFPPGTSKWNKIEHRLFSFISANWRGRPLTSLVAIVSLIAATTTRTGLRVRAEIDKGRYPLGVKVPPKELARVRIRKHDFHGDWNYTIRPTRRRR